MKLTKPSLVLIILISAITSSFAHSSALQRKFKHRGKIETKYDKFKDQTTISLKPYYVQGTAPKLDPTAGLEIYAAFVYPGQQLSKQPNAVLFGIVSTSTNDFMYESNRGLIALVDGERLDLGQMERIDSTYKKKAILIPDRYYVETLSVSVPYEVFLKLTNGKSVEMQAGRREFRLKDEHLEALRELVSRMTP